MDTQPQLLRLTDKESGFVAALFKHDFNLANAYIDAGYKASNRQTAEKSAAELIKKEKIQKAITAAVELRNDPSTIDQPRLVKEISRLAFSDFRNVFQVQDGRLKIKNSLDLTDDAAAAVASIRITERTNPHGDESVTVEIKFWDKLKAIDMAARHLGLYERDNQRSLEVNFTTELPVKAMTAEEWLSQNTENGAVLDGISD
jgi:phage terminase small subunit